MPRFECDVDTTLPPDSVRAAILDFSERRPEIWPWLAREFYEVYEVGDTYAVIKEGSAKGNPTPQQVWARERYDWSVPNTIKWTVEESNYALPGSYMSLSITPRDGESHLHIVWERKGSTLMSKMGLGTMKFLGPKMIGGYVKKVCDDLAARG